MALAAAATIAAAWQCGASSERERGRSSSKSSTPSQRAGRDLERRYTGDGLLESRGDSEGGPPQSSDVDASRYIAAGLTNQPLRITVLGGGNFGTAMAYVRIPAPNHAVHCICMS